jgi:hypothetical protein
VWTDETWVGEEGGDYTADVSTAFAAAVSEECDLIDYQNKPLVLGTVAAATYVAEVLAEREGQVLQRVIDQCAEDGTEVSEGVVGGASARRPRPLVIGMAGCSAAGKSTLCSAFCEAVAGVSVLEADHWYRKPDDPQCPQFDLEGLPWPDGVVPDAFLAR